MLDHPINSQFIFLISLLFFFLFFCKGFDKWSWAVELYTCIEMPSLLCCAYYNLYRWWSKRQQHTTIRPHRIQITRRRQLPCTRNESNTIFAAVATCSCQIEKSPSPLRNNKQMNPPIWMKSVNSLSLSRKKEGAARNTLVSRASKKKHLQIFFFFFFLFWWRMTMALYALHISTWQIEKVTRDVNAYKRHRSSVQLLVVCGCCIIQFWLSAVATVRGSGYPMQPPTFATKLPHLPF